MQDIEAMPINQRIILWFLFGQVGISSASICYALSGIKLETYFPTGENNEYGIRTSDMHFFPPSDPSDFHRCMLLLELIPEWRARLPEVAVKFPRWKPIVDAWDELEYLYEQERHNEDGKAPKLYARMKELRV
jgi:hypothetical protein